MRALFWYFLRAFFVRNERPDDRDDGDGEDDADEEVPFV